MKNKTLETHKHTHSNPTKHGSFRIGCEQCWERMRAEHQIEISLAFFLEASIVQGLSLGWLRSVFQNIEV